MPNTNQDKKSDAFDKNLGIDLSLDEDDIPINLSQIYLGSENKDERLFVEHLCKKY